MTPQTARKAARCVVFPIDGIRFRVAGETGAYDVYPDLISGELLCFVPGAPEMQSFDCSGASQERSISMPVDDLAGAVPQRIEFKKTQLSLGVGNHYAYFIGLGDKVVETSTDPCRSCKGQRTINGSECLTCDGTGRKRTTKVPILWQVSPTKIDEEWVTHTLTEPGKLQNGNPKSASTLWTRIRVLSGGLTNPAEQASWYKQLTKPIKIPVNLNIIENDAGDNVVIASVVLRKPSNGNAPQPPPPPPAQEPGW